VVHCWKKGRRRAAGEAEEDEKVDIYKEIELEDCPFCGGAGLLEEENGWCWYVMCMDCGSQTASIEYNTPEERLEAAKKAAQLWNFRKVVGAHPGE
jgi:hypothetical protein